MSDHDINRYMRCVTWLALGMVVVALAACDDAELKGAKAEVKKIEAKLDLPAVPTFDVPDSTNPHNVREMRLIGRGMLDTEVEVKGYVVWIYDCVKHGGAKGPIEGETEEEKRKLVEKHPENCWKPHFIIGDSADTPPGRGIQVVDVPRVPRADDLRKMRRMTREERDALKKPPEIGEGDEVIVTGKWVLRSQEGFANSIGVLQYDALRKPGDPVEGEEGEE